MPAKKTTTSIKKKQSSSKTTKKTKKSLDQSSSISADNKILVIVESPAKARTIAQFLGPQYVVKASMGHIVELADKNMKNLVQKKFVPDYEVIDGKQKIINELKKDSKKAQKIYLATDEDREGEAISWHIAQQLGLDHKKTPRIVFHEITKSALEHALDHPRTIDMNLVHAQQGRSVLDKIVGFSLSPLLWKKIKNGLSAGRVQSVAVRLIVEREREIQAFVPESSWKLEAFLKYKKETIVCELVKNNGKHCKRENIDEVKKFLNDYFGSEGNIEVSQQKIGEKNYDCATIRCQPSDFFILEDIIKKQGTKNPPAPFITSTLQQTASRIFGRSVKQVMSTAQKLYENGYITYMRTDSFSLSQQALGQLKSYVVSSFGDQYYQQRIFTKKSKNAQEAHEAIRPTDISRKPSSLGIDGYQKKLYDLIWSRTVASQMSDAKVENTYYIFSPQGSNQERISKGQVVIFDGFLKVYHYVDAEDTLLPAISQGEMLSVDYIKAQQQYSKPPARFTEATLVKMLESKGIGRPSTYAPTISTVQERGYVVKDEKKLKPTEIAFVVVDYLIKYFADLMDYDFTAGLEKKLDNIAEGQVEWDSMLDEFYQGFEKELKKADDSQKEDILVGRECPQCKEGQLVVKFSKTGKFFGCNRYPECTYIEESKESHDRLAPLKEKYEGKPCPAGGTIVVKLGRFGPFLTSSDYPTVKWISPIPDEKQEQLEQKYGGKQCTECKIGVMHVKKGKYRGRTNYFLGCSRYPDCKHTEQIEQ